MTIDQYFDSFVWENYIECKGDPGSVRMAFNAAISAAHLADHYWAYLKRHDETRLYKFKHDVNNFREWLNKETNGASEDIRGIANAYKHLYTKGNEYSEISSTGAVESVPLRHSNVSEVFQDVDGGSETSCIVFYTTRAGVKKEFLPVLEVLVNYWRKKIDNE
jgi:hypothetical protein